MCYTKIKNEVIIYENYKNDLKKISNDVYDEIKQQVDSDESIKLAVAEVTIEIIEKYLEKIIVIENK